MPFSHLLSYRMKWIDRARELSRVLLSLVFMFSGLAKAVDPTGTVIKVQEYQRVVFDLSYSWIYESSVLIAFALIAVEFALGAFLMAGIYRRLCTRLILVILLMMSCLTGYIYISGTQMDCGCFGDVLRLTPFETFVKNLIMLPLAFFTMRGARRLVHLFSRSERWIPAILAVGGILLFMHQNYSDVPYYDLLPYRTGTDIREQIRRADSVAMARIEEETRYVYERNGVQRLFAISELPDSTWSYISMSQPQGLERLQVGNGFVLLTPEGEEITDLIFDDERGVMLLCSPSWQRADQSRIEVINELYRYAKEQGYKFYAVSSSLADEEAEWRYMTGGSYPSLFLDGGTIKLLARANPALLFIRSGKILDKVSPTRLPEMEDVPEFVEGCMAGSHRTTPSWWHTIPLVLLGGFVLYGLVRRLARKILAVRYLHAKQRHHD